MTQNPRSRRSNFVSALVLGEAREVLTLLRRNARFSPWTDRSGEHALVLGLKGLKETTSTIAADALFAVKALEPFLDLVTSEEVNSIITFAALASAERIVVQGLVRSQEPDVREALQKVIAAAFACRYDPTEPARDELVSVGIVQLLSSVLSCGKHARSLNDGDIFHSYLTCVRIALSPKGSEVVKRACFRVVVDMTARLFSQWATTEECLGDHNSSGKSSLRQLRNALRTHGILGISSKSIKFDGDGCWGAPALSCILHLVCFLFEPTNGPSSPQKTFGLSILSSVLSCPGFDKIVSSSPEIREVVCRDASLGVLRLLGSFREPVSVVAAAFSVAHLIIENLGSHAGPFLANLCSRIFPSYVKGIVSTSESFEIDRGAREVGLDALSSLLYHREFLAVSYASLDCNPRAPDAVAILIGALADFVQSHERSRARNRTTPVEVSKRDSEEDSRIEQDEGLSGLNLAPVLQAADMLVSVVETICNRATGPTELVEIVPSWSEQGGARRRIVTEEMREMKNQKKQRLKAAERFNRTSGKGGGRSLIGLLRESSNTGNRTSSLATAASDYTEGDISTGVSFLRSTPNLDKSAIGMVLSEPDPVSQRVLSGYSGSFDFHGRPFTDCIRLYLESFRLPGEAQKIDRVMHAFARSFFEQNKEPLVAGDRHPLASADAAFVLSFSIVMLNTDQHNASVKKRMSMEDFVRNNRGINDGKDLPREFLEEIFSSIWENEIRMTDESGMGALTDVHWEEQLREWNEDLRGENASRLVVPEDMKAAEEDIFSLAWPGILSATTVSLHCAQNPESSQRALEAILSVARCSVSFRMTDSADSCVAALCDASTLRDGPLSMAMVAFGASIKAQMAAVTLFGVLRECGDWVRLAGWSPVICCFLRLHLLNLLPPELEAMIGTYGNELTDPDGGSLPASRLVPSWWPGNMERNRLKRERSTDNVASSLFSFLTFTSEEDLAPEHPRREDIPPEFLSVATEEEEDARALALKCIADCRPDEVLIKDTRFLSHHSFEKYLSAIARAAEKMLSDNVNGRGLGDDVTRDSLGGGFGQSSSAIPLTPKVRTSNGSVDHSPAVLSPEDEAKAQDLSAAFLIDLLGELTLRNRDRLNVVWPFCHDVIIKTLAPASSPSPVVERAVVNLLRVAMRCMQREEIRCDVLRTLNLLVKLPSKVAFSIAIPLSAGVFQIVRAHAAYIHKTSGWHTLLSIVESCSRFPEPAAHFGFQTLLFLLQSKGGKHSLRPETFAVFLDAIFAYASAPLARSTEAVDLLARMARKVDILIKTEKSETGVRDGAGKTDHEPENRAWVEYWSPILMAVAQVCRDDRPEVRNHALQRLEQLIGVGGITEGLDWKERARMFNSVVYPLVADIFDPDGHFASRSAVRRRVDPKHSDRDDSPDNKTRIRLTALLGKVFLHHHRGLSANLDADQFLKLWTGFLECFQIAMSPSSGATASLRGHFVEILKNTLIVAASNQVLVQDIDPLWAVTDKAVKSVIPDWPSILEPGVIREIFPPDGPLEGD